jgi:hypothetical protein
MGMALFFADDMDKVSREELQQIIWHGAWHKKVEGDFTGISATVRDGSGSVVILETLGASSRFAKSNN